MRLFDRSFAGGDGSLFLDIEGLDQVGRMNVQRLSQVDQHRERGIVLPAFKLTSMIAIAAQARLSIAPMRSVRPSTAVMALHGACLIGVMLWPDPPIIDDTPQVIQLEVVTAPTREEWPVGFNRAEEC
jgi:hypothetical protein